MDVRIYTAFDPPPKGGLLCKDKSLARESERDSCDVNLIMKRYEKTGELPEGFDAPGFFGDVSEMGDFRKIQDTMVLGNQLFMLLPPDERAKFDNDVVKFLDFAEDPANRGELVKLGLLPDVEKPAEGPAPAGGQASPGGSAGATDTPAGK